MRKTKHIRRDGRKEERKGRKRRRRGRRQGEAKVRREQTGDGKRE